MLFERIEDPGLSQHSYVVGCERDGRVVTGAFTARVEARADS